MPKTKAIKDEHARPARVKKNRKERRKEQKKDRRREIKQKVKEERQKMQQDLVTKGDVPMKEE